MADLSTSNSQFATAVGGDVKALFTLITGAANIASLTNLKTATKADLVAALNEIFDLASAAASSGGAVIDDNTARTTTAYSSSKVESVSSAKALALIADGATAGTTTWSSTQINSQIAALATQVQNILAAAPTAYDTFKEVSDYIASDTTATAGLLSAVANALRVDINQTFTTPQVTQGIANLVKLGAAKQSDLSALITAIGDTTVDLRATYLAARNS